MASAVQILTIEPTDSLASLRERLYGARGARLLLILPDDAALFRRRLNLILLQREAQRQGAQLALATRDPVVAAHSAALNISCFPTAEAGAAGRWKRGRQRLLAAPSREANGRGQKELQSAASRLQKGEAKASRPLQLITRLLTICLLLGVAGAAVSAVVPGAIVEVSPRRETITVSAPLIADAAASGIDFEKGIVPARRHRVMVETTATAPTSGIRTLEATPARGIVTFRNLTAAPLRVPANTMLSANALDPVLFRTEVDVVVPAGPGSESNAPFVAMSRYAGPVGNVSTGAIDAIVGSLSGQLSVGNPAPAAGGTAPSVNVVAAADRQRLLDIARSQLQALAYESITLNLTETEVVAIESIGIEEERKEWTRFSTEIGLMARELTLDMRAVVTALVIDDRFGKQVALARLKDRLEPEQTLLEESLSYARGPARWQAEAGTVAMTATISGTTEAMVDLAHLRQTLAGRTLDEAREILLSRDDLSQSEPPMIEIFPAAFGRMPFLAVRIALRLREAK